MLIPLLCLGSLIGLSPSSLAASPPSSLGAVAGQPATTHWAQHPLSSTARQQENAPPIELADQVGARSNLAGLWTGLEVRDLDGTTWTPDRLLGRVVLLDFWATWCAPCLAELPNLRRIHRELGRSGVPGGATTQSPAALVPSEDQGARDVLILGVALDAMESERLRTWLRHRDLPWPQIHERRGVDGEMARRFAVEAVPRTLVLDRRGRLVAVDLRGEALFAVLRDLAASSRPQSAP